MPFTPVVKELQVLQQGGEVFTPVATWIDAIQSTSTPGSYNLATARSNMGLAVGAPLFVIFSADGPFWANFNAAAAIPSGNTTNGTASEFSPNQRYLDNTVTAIGVVSAANQNISMQFFRA